MKPEPRLIARLLIVAILGITVILGTAQSPARAQASRHLYLILLPGLCAYPYSDSQCHGRISAQRRGASTFRTLQAALRTAGVKRVDVGYSYDPAHPDSYTVANTRQHVAISVRALNIQLRSIVARDPHATFDLVAHSLGGVVAAEWVVANGRSNPALLRRIHSIVTYDSPLRGIQPGIGRYAVVQLFLGPVLGDLRPSSPTIKRITAFSSAWWAVHAHLHTIANRADLVVPPREAMLGQTRVVRDASCPRDILFIRSCHGAVLADAALNRWVACHWITTALQCVPPTATATSSPTSTATPAPSSTATPTLTPQPPATPVTTPTETSTPATTPPLPPTLTPSAL